MHGEPPIENEFGFAYVLRGLVGDVNDLRKSFIASDRKLDQMISKVEGIAAQLDDKTNGLETQIKSIQTEKMNNIPRWVIGAVAALPPIIAAIVAAFHSFIKGAP